MLYIGVTSNLEGRVRQHRERSTPGFTRDYVVVQLVYFEELEDARDAIGREKQLKGWVRRKKIALIESINPDWRDLSLDW